MKFIGNILAALLSPIWFLISWIPSVFNAIFYGKYIYYDFHITSLKDYLVTVYGHSYWTSLFALIFIFIPFQLIKDSYQRKGRKLAFAKKAGLLGIILLLLIVAFGTFSNIWWVPWYKNFLYIIYAAGFGVLFAWLLHILVDRYEEVQK